MGDGTCNLDGISFVLRICGKSWNDLKRYDLDLDDDKDGWRNPRRPLKNLPESWPMSNIVYPWCTKNGMPQ